MSAGGIINKNPRRMAHHLGLVEKHNRFVDWNPACPEPDEGRFRLSLLSRRIGRGQVPGGIMVLILCCQWTLLSEGE